MREYEDFINGLTQGCDFRQEECDPIEVRIVYAIEVLPEQFELTKSVLHGEYTEEAFDCILYFKNKRTLLKAGTTLVLKDIKIVNTSGL